MNAVIKSLILGLILFFNLKVIAYFPSEWVLTIAVLLMILSLFRIRFAIILSMFMVFFSMLYYSTELAGLYGIAGLIFIIIFYPMSEFAEVYFLLFSIPLLSSQSIPLEFIIIPLVPLLLEQANVLVVIIFFFFYSLIMIITNTNIIGYISVTLPAHYYYYALVPIPPVFYDLSWVVNKLYAFLDFSKLKDILFNITKAFLDNPIIILQMSFWGMSVGTINHLRKTTKKNPLLVGYLGGLLVLLLFYFLVHIMGFEKINLSLKIIYTYIIFIYLFVFVCAVLRKYTIKDVVLFINTLQWNKKEKSKKKIITVASPSNVFLPDNLAAGGNSLKKEITNKFDFNKCSLQEAVEMSVQLNDYINNNFSMDLTFLGIDVFKSANLKKEEKENAIQFSFDQFHLFIDKIVSSFGAKLLNRSGDGVIYSFEITNRALFSARSIVAKLGLFNQKINKLKNDFHVRIGINTGKIIRGENIEGGKTFSRVLDITGHLLKLAHMDQVLVGENTYKALEDKSFLRKVFFSEEDRVDVYSFKEEFISSSNG